MIGCLSFPIQTLLPWKKNNQLEYCCQLLNLVDVLLLILHWKIFHTLSPPHFVRAQSIFPKEKWTEEFKNNLNDNLLPKFSINIMKSLLGWTFVGMIVVFNHSVAFFVASGFQYPFNPVWCLRLNFSARLNEETRSFNLLWWDRCQ